MALLPLLTFRRVSTTQAPSPGVQSLRGVLRRRYSLGVFPVQRFQAFASASSSASEDAKDIVKLTTGLIATLAALVLGLLISSAKGTFDQVDRELTQNSIRVVLLDRDLAEYGPETSEARALLKSSYTEATNQLISAVRLSRKDGILPPG